MTSSPRIGARQSAPRYAARRDRAICIVLLAVLVPLTGCTKPPVRPAPPPPVEVDVAQPVVRESVEWDEYTGRLAAVESVQVRTRVTGFIDKIHFKAGEIVRKDDLLFTIDQRPFRAEVSRAEAAVSRAQAVLEHAEYDLHRVENFMAGEVAAEKEHRDALFAERTARADLEQSLAEQRLAALDLEWTEVRAPIAGRISREFVTVGNLVHDGSDSATLLTTIVSLDPIHCYFDADEQAYLKYARMSRSGERVSSRDTANPVRVALFDEQEFAHEGVTDFVDNAIDQQTGTLRARAILPNPQELLIPGLFVRVRLLGSGRRPMVFVPDEAIGTDQTSRLVYLVDEKNTVHPRPVQVGRLQNGLRRILAGLDGTETIVVNGISRVRPDAVVKPNPRPICPEAWSPDAVADAAARAGHAHTTTDGATP